MQYTRHDDRTEIPYECGVDEACQRIGRKSYKCLQEHHQMSLHRLLVFSGATLIHQGRA